MFICWKNFWSSPKVISYLNTHTWERNIGGGCCGEFTERRYWTILAGQVINAKVKKVGTVHCP